jgi:oxygen-dependent protoporphyrinogen oxidase
VLDRTDDELAALASEQLRSVLHIDGPVLFTRVFRWNRATPQYLVGHGTTIDRIEARLRESPGLYLTGSGYRGTGIPDCIADARRVAAEAAGALR